MNLKDILEEVRYGKEYDEMKLMDDEMKLMEDLLEDCEEVEGLEEGVKYFKVSKRLNKLAIRLQAKTKEVPQAKGLISKVKSAAKKFEALENSFKSGTITKAQARVKYDGIKKDYKEVMSALKKKELMTALKVAGAIAIVAGIVAAILFGLGPLAALVGAKSVETVPPSVKELLGRQQSALKNITGRASLAPGGKIDLKAFGLGKAQMTPEVLKRLGIK